jgi:hypothetical protein
VPRHHGAVGLFLVTIGGNPGRLGARPRLRSFEGTHGPNRNIQITPSRTRPPKWTNERNRNHRDPASRLTCKTKLVILICTAMIVENMLHIRGSTYPESREARFDASECGRSGDPRWISLQIKSSGFARSTKARRILGWR